MTTEFFKKLSSDLASLLENGEDYNALIEVVNELVKITYYDEDIKKFSKPHISAIILICNQLICFERVHIELYRYIYGGIVPFDKTGASKILDLLITSDEFGLEELVNSTG
ncbi:hypothetical protein C2G38_2195079 [Gigaspora rosea]|uniref:Uncharacterized protein n=1 Tax=Gigaspora rosea TaxID=44941 RepID=A0A397UW38_9GLOM|nr:hypothetical protein C2G38_2195079 [Gigaspora rosea]